MTDRIDEFLSAFTKFSDDKPVCYGLSMGDLRKAQSDRERMSWQPIETAPKDGSRVLVWAQPYTAPCSAEHNGICGWCIMGPELKHQPTHWMPLPEPPLTTTDRPTLLVET